MNHSILFFNLGTPELIIISFVLVPLILMVFCIIDIMRANFKDSTHKLLWVLIVVLAPLVGSIVYLVFGRNKSFTRI